jgi:hypothetical protein
VNEDEHGITPPNVTAMTLEPKDGGWLVTIEQGNGDVIKTLELTDWERAQLACLLDTPAVECAAPRSSSGGGAVHVEFVDFGRCPLK